MLFKFISEFSSFVNLNLYDAIISHKPLTHHASWLVNQSQVTRRWVGVWPGLTRVMTTLTTNDQDKREQTGDGCDFLINNFYTATTVKS